MSVDLAAFQPALTEQEQNTAAHLGKIVTMIGGHYAKNEGKSPFEHPAVVWPAHKHDLNLLNELLSFASMKADTSNRDRCEVIVDTAKEIAKRELVELGYSMNIAAPVSVATLKKAVKKKPEIAKEAPVLAATPATPASTTPEIMPLVAVPSATLKLSDRTRLIDLPPIVFLERDPVEVTKARGHQIDPSRPEGYAPVMPSYKLFAVTGNPYPPAADKTVQTSPRYQPLVKVSYATWKLLAERKMMALKPIESEISDICALAGVVPDRDAKACIQDTLRDLTIIGIAEAILVGNDRHFRVTAPEMKAEPLAAAS